MACSYVGKLPPSLALGLVIHANWKRIFSLVGSVECFGDNCYALAFGIPAILMIVAVGK